LPKPWTIRDPVHGYIEPSEQEIRILDTQAMQRLRGIKQLANTHLVFPGATHTRFEHSYGTMHMAGAMAMRIKGLNDNQDRVRRIRLAALVHDIGHGPFSHVSEDIMSRVIKQDRKFDNVKIALDAIQLVDPIRTELGKDIDAVLDLLGNKEKANIDHDFIDSPIDADKLDYLNRDSYYCGVPYGHPDTLHILHTIMGFHPGHDESYLGIGRKGIEAVEGLWVARYHMHAVVYNHKVRHIADDMLIRATVASIEDGGLDARNFDYRERDADFLKAYLSMDDRSLMDTVIEKGGRGGDLMERLSERRLLKKAYAKDIARFVGLAKDHITRLDRARIAKLEEEIATDAKADPFHTIIDKQTIENPTYKAPVGLVSSGRILVEDEPPNPPRFIDEMPGPWSSETKSMQKIWVFSDNETKERVGEIAGRVLESL
jgi:HD superfamily phosphohydrolase